VESLVDCAHCALSKLLGEAIKLVWVIGEKGNFLNLLIELTIGKESIIWNFCLGLESSHDLDHDFRVLFDEVITDSILIKKFEHVWSQSLDAARAVEVYFKMHLMLEILRPEWEGSYLLMKTGWELMRSRMFSGKSSSGRTSLERCLVCTVLV
jgi:hypothetical protein